MNGDVCGGKNEPTWVLAKMGRLRGQWKGRFREERKELKEFQAEI